MTVYACFRYPQAPSNEVKWSRALVIATGVLVIQPEAEVAAAAEVATAPAATAVSAAAAEATAVAAAVANCQIVKLSNFGNPRCGTQA